MLKMRLLAVTFLIGALFASINYAIAREDDDDKQTLSRQFTSSSKLISKTLDTTQPNCRPYGLVKWWGSVKNVLSCKIDQVACDEGGPDEWGDYDHKQSSVCGILLCPCSCLILAAFLPFMCCQCTPDTIYSDDYRL